MSMSGAATRPDTAIQTVSAPTAQETRVCMTGVTGILAEYVRWMRLAGRAETTIATRRIVLALLVRHAGKPLEELTEDDLFAWQCSLGLLAPATRATYLSHVAAFYRWWAERHGGEDPSRVLVKPKVPRGLPMPIAEQDLARVLAAVPLDVQLWLSLAAFAGLRASEIAGLRREDVLDRALPPMLVVTGKGGQTRVVPAPPTLVEALNAFGMPARGMIFRRADGRPETGKHVSATCNRWLHRLGIRASLHKGRHRFATRLYRASGNDLRLTQELLGHASPSTTAIYTLVDPSAAAPAVNAIDRPLLPPTKDAQ